MSTDELFEWIKTSRGITVTDEVFDQLQAGLAASIKEQQAQQSIRVVKARVGKDATVQQIAEEVGLAALSRIPYSRAYALDDDARLQLGALVIACQRQNADPRSLLGRLVGVLPGWLQNRPDADAGTIPPLPIDPVTGLRVANPWEGEITSDKAKSREVLKSQSPALARWLEKCSKNGGQPSAAMLDELEADRREAEYLRKLPYGHNEWQSNKLRADSGANQTERQLFAKEIEDYHLLNFHRTEAKLGSPQLQYGNLTTRMTIGRQVGMKEMEIFKAGREIYEGWKNQEKAQAA